jgi:hypothetical protein
MFKLAEENQGKIFVSTILIAFWFFSKTFCSNTDKIQVIRLQGL